MPFAQASVRELVSAATLDRGVRLRGELRDRMEYCFGTCLGDVRLHFSEGSRIANERLGSLAFAVDGHVCFRPGFDESLGSAFTAVLAHEMAHVVQKRLRGNDAVGERAPSALLEREAMRSTAQVQGGEGVSPLTPDLWEGPRCWDIEGHYYTIFAVALVAGLPLRDAARVAFFAQFPDQVKELDAIPAGTGWIEGYGQFTLLDMAVNVMMTEYWAVEHSGAFVHKHTGWAWTNYLTDPWIREYWDNQLLGAVQYCQHHWEIQTGLHSLTGRDAEQETIFRTQKLDHLQPDTFEFGLAIHAYGDSFAHRVACKPPVMYAAPAGHFCKGHAADMINCRKDDYRRYAYGLLEIFSRRWQTPKLTVERAKEFSQAIDNVCGLTNPCNQIELLLNLADDAWHVSPYFETEAPRLQSVHTSIASWIWRPAADSVPWIDFQKESGVFGKPDKSWMELDLAHDTYVQSGYQCAKVWCDGARLAGMPAFNDQLYIDNLIHSEAMKMFDLPQFYGQIPADEERRNSRLFMPKLREYR
jgi:hypothetical protein